MYYATFPDWHRWSNLYVKINTDDRDQAIKTANYYLGNKWDKVIAERNFLTSGYLGQLGTTL